MFLGNEVIGSLSVFETDHVGSFPTSPTKAGKCNGCILAP
jgi:hypothetical protein